MIKFNSNKEQVEELINELGREFDWIYKVGLTPEENLRSFVIMLASLKEESYSRGFDNGREEGFSEGEKEGYFSAIHKMKKDVISYIGNYEENDD